ncbi:TPA: hypothetical protein DCQ44_03025 [Candidatus Taylorbacteria bacterium]|nr:hypothetical protein [Candidatus Taylorbacteria bacterium]
MAHRTYESSLWEQSELILELYGPWSDEFNDLLKEHGYDERFVGNARRRANHLMLKVERRTFTMENPMKDRETEQRLWNECINIINNTTEGPDSVRFYDFLKRNADNPELIAKAQAGARLRREVLKDELAQKRARGY